MNMPDIRHDFFIKATPQRLYNALTEQKEISSWWTEKCKVCPTEGTDAEFYWTDHGWKVIMQIAKLDPGKYIEWRCTASNMQDTDAWIGTTLRFKLATQGDGANLQFEQVGYKDSPCFQECNPGWAFVLGKSLKSYIETGRGLPYRAEGANPKS